VIWAATIAAVDWRQRKVPNLLLLAAVLPAGVALAWFGRGPLGLSPLPSLLGAVVGAVLLLPGYFQSKLGAGDVKLAAAFGLLQGLDGLLFTLLFSALLLGAMSVLTLVRLGSVGARSARLPAAVALSGGFAFALLLTFWGNG
jgi:prepilin peptidase CpaA